MLMASCPRLNWLTVIDLLSVLIQLIPIVMDSFLELNLKMPHDLNVEEGDKTNSMPLT